jgi:hypothetical protein
MPRRWPEARTGKENRHAAESTPDGWLPPRSAPGSARGHRLRSGLPRPVTPWPIRMPAPREDRWPWRPAPAWVASKPPIGCRRQPTGTPRRLHAARRCGLCAACVSKMTRCQAIRRRDAGSQATCSGQITGRDPPEMPECFGWRSGNRHMDGIPGRTAGVWDVTQRLRRRLPRAIWVSQLAVCKAGDVRLPADDVRMPTCERTNLTTADPPDRPIACSRRPATGASRQDLRRGRRLTEATWNACHACVKGIA